MRAVSPFTEKGGRLFHSCATTTTEHFQVRFDLTHRLTEFGLILQLPLAVSRRGQVRKDADERRPKKCSLPTSANSFVGQAREPLRVGNSAGFCRLAADPLRLAFEWDLFFVGFVSQRFVRGAKKFSLPLRRFR